MPEGAKGVSIFDSRSEERFLSKNDYLLHLERTQTDNYRDFSLLSVYFKSIDCCTMWQSHDSRPEVVGSEAKRVHAELLSTLLSKVFVSLD